MHNFLDTVTLVELFDAPGPAVQRTIEAGGWGGMLWPGHPDWNADPAHMAEGMQSGTQLLSLAIHFFTVRHPEASDFQVITAAQVLCSNAVEFLGGYPVEEHDLYQQAERWVWSLAGGLPPSPEGAIGLTPPLDEEGRPLVPGGDLAAFTRAMVAVMEALVFGTEPEARRLARHLLEQAGDDRALRAAEIFQQVALGQVPDLDVAVSCADCGAEDLELWYTGQLWGETLCQSCYEARSAAGTARPLGLGERDHGDT